MIVVVGGQTRNCGKTTTVCQIISATREAEWTAVKITSHAHGADLSQPLVTEEPGPNVGTDTGRYLTAGAAHALLIRSRPEHLADAVSRLAAANIIFESNSVLKVVSPDLVVFVTGAAEDSKESALLARNQADVIIAGDVPQSFLGAIRSKLNGQRS